VIGQFFTAYGSLLPIVDSPLHIRWGISTNA